jgi:O-antigen/teichoic acid export membrane protein
MSHTKVVAYNTAIHTLGKVIAVTISFFLFKAIAGYLGVSGIGEYTTIFAWSNFLAILADLGFQIIMVRALSTSQEDQNRIASTIFSMRTTVAIIVFALGSLIAQFLPYSSTVKIGIVVGAVATFWLSLNVTMVGIFQANFRMDKAVLTDLVGKILNYLGILYVISIDGGLLAVMSAYIIGNFINLVASYILARQYVSIRFIFDLQAWQKYFQDAVTFGAILIFAYIYFRIDAVILSLLKNSYDVGIYGVPYKILDIILMLPAIFMGVVFPLFAKYGQADRERLKHIFRKSQDLLIIFGLPITVGIILLAEPIVRLISSEEFVLASSVTIFNYPVTAVTTLQILMVAVFLSFLSHPYNYILTANNFQQNLIKPNIVYAAFNIILNILLVPYFSYLAAAIITVSTEFLVYLVPRHLTKKLLGIEGASLVWEKVIISTAAMGVIVIFTKDLFIAIPVFVGGIVYLGVLWLIGGIDREMVKELIAKT